MNEGQLTAADFLPGMNVLFIPAWAHGDAGHRDCERGVVTSQNGKVVYVRYWGFARIGYLKANPEATDPDHLRILEATL